MSSRLHLLNDLLQEIYGGHKRMFKQICADYVVKQQIAKKDPNIWAFFYRGSVYFDQLASGKAKATILDESLEESFEKDIAPWEYSETTDYALIRHLIISTLNAFSSLEDLKIIFPDSLHWVLEKNVDLFSRGVPNPEKAMKWRKDRMEKFIPIIQQYMAFSLIVEK